MFGEATSARRPWLAVAFRGGGAMDYALEQLGQASSGLSRAAGELGHLGETELRVGKRKPAFGLLGGGQQVIGLGLLLDLHAAAFEQLQLAIKRAQANLKLAQNGLATSGRGGQEPDETVEPGRGSR